LKAVHGMYIRQQIDMFNALKQTFGAEVEAVIRQKSSRDACLAFQTLAQQTGKTSISDLIAVLWEPLRSKGFEFTQEQTEQGVQMKCTVCPFASMYRAMGGADWGYALYCAADEYLTQAFNPNIGFKRDHTLMEGNEFCDHFYFYKK
jgi:hypothetical protein